MKKSLIGIILLMVFALALPIGASAQNCSPRKHNASYYRNYVARNHQAPKPSFWQRHRNTRNILLSTGGGALIGGLWGGNRKSIAKGAAVGAGAGALYTFILKPKRRNY